MANKNKRFNGKGQSYRKGSKSRNDSFSKDKSDMSYDEETRSGKDRQKCSSSRPNDWKWYAQNEQLLRDTASFSYNTPLGSVVRRTVSGDQPVDSAGVPGVMAIYTTPAYGNSDSAVSPLNVAIRNIYSFVRHANSGHANYDAPDLGIYLMAMDNIYSFMAYLRRIYGVVMTYSYTNKYYPVAITNAMGVDFEDVHAHLADFRAMINSFAVKVGSMCVPSSMSVFARHMWMYEGYYTDTDQNKAQTYLYVPTGFYHYQLRNKLVNEGVYDTSGMLCYKLLTPYGDPSSQEVSNVKLLTTEVLHQYGESMLEPVLRSEDMNIMSGDILKAFGSNGVYMIPMIPENYVVVPSYSREVLDQINNCTLIGDNVYYTDESDFDKGYNVLVQDPNHGYLIGKTCTEIPMGVAKRLTLNLDRLTAKTFVNFDHDDVTPADTMVATRLTNVYDPQDVSIIANGMVGGAAIQVRPGSGSPAWVNTTGTDIANYARIFYYARGGLIVSEMICALLPVTLQWDFTTMTTEELLKEYVNKAVTSMQLDTARINMVTNFRRHPRVAYQYSLYVKATADGAPKEVNEHGKYVADISDLNQWTVIGAQELCNMAETALLSEFNVTQYGRKA